MSPDRPQQYPASTDPPRLARRSSPRRAGRTPLRPTVVGVLASLLAAVLAAVVLSTAPSATSIRSTEIRAQGQGADAEHADTTRAARGVGAPRVEAAQRLLGRQTAAIRDGSRVDYLDTIDPHPASEDFATIAERTFDNLSRMGVVTARFDDLVADQGGLTPERREQLGPGAFVAETTLRFRLGGPDREHEWSTPLRLTFVQRGGETYLANDREGTGSSEPLPLWLLDEVHAVRGANSMVIGTADKELLRNYREVADRAVPKVSEIWGRDWAEYLVLLVPDTQQQMERTIGAEHDSQTAVAAVTTSVARAEPAEASHIVVNPATFADIGELGRLVVLTHEVAHVATAATVSQMPMWLSEGFADYVGFRDAGLPTSRVARELLDGVRAHGPPDRLPGSEEFDPRAGELDQAYEASWSACHYIASRWSEDTLVRLYREVDLAGTEQDADEAFERVLGIGMTQFTADWRDYVASLA